VGVRVKILLEIYGKEHEIIALLNSGYESEEPEIALPKDIAEKLGLWPPKEFHLDEALTAGGSISVYTLKEKARMKIKLDERETKPVDCLVVISPTLPEPIISDSAIDALNIVVISYKKGLWRHSTDRPDVVRKSAEK